MSNDEQDLKANNEYQILLVKKNNVFDTYKVKVFLTEDATVEELKESVFKEFNLDYKNQEAYRLSITNISEEKIIYDESNTNTTKKTNTKNNKGDNMSKINNKKEEIKQEKTEVSKNSKSGFDAKYFSYVINKNAYSGLNEKDKNNVYKFINIHVSPYHKVQLILNENAYVNRFEGSKKISVKMNDVKEIKGYSKSLTNFDKWRYEKMDSYSLSKLPNIAITKTKELFKEAEIADEQQAEAVSVVEQQKQDVQQLQKSPFDVDENDNVEQVENDEEISM